VGQVRHRRGYAARVGLSRGAIQKAKAAGRLVLHADGSIDADASDARRAETTDPSKGKRGFARLEWQKLRERNEALDCRVYARAAAWIVGADRWSEARWQDLERQLAVETAVADGEAPARPAPRPAPRRRTRRSSYMG